jgi:hypothetical protein
MIKEVICLEIEGVPGLKPIAAELIGTLVMIQTNKKGLKQACGYNTDADCLATVISNAAQFPLGAHYWYGVMSIQAMCKMCPDKHICNGVNTVVIKKNERVKCVLIHN